VGDVRTLVISDLHLGARSGRDVLRRPAALEALLAHVAEADRLVLLGDIVEMLEGRPRAALDDATPVLSAIGDAVGQSREIVLVPGNHDHALVYPWLQQRRAAGRVVRPSERVGVRSSRPLAKVVAALRPARVQVRYPGVWLSPGVWAHHGHYLDRHLVRRPQLGGHATTDHYERALGATATRLTAGLAASMPLQVGDAVDRAGRLVAKTAILARPMVAALPGAGFLAPLSAGALGYQFRRAGLPAMASVADHLAVDATDVIFGHVHRRGPSHGEERAEWHQGARRMWNTGCWVYEPLLLAGAEPPHPYWPGGALWVDDTGIRSIGILDALTPDALR
jgi:Calcineurin-like phosphoesterase